MRRLLLFLSLVALSRAPVHAQDPVVQAAVDAVRIDSLMKDLRLLSGEDSVNVGNGSELIVSRNNNNAGNALAADWLQQRMAAMGYTPQVQTFNTIGENVYALKVGALHPDRKVVICGHYDAMPGGPVAAPAADDDGSGACAVLEAMRVLAPYTFENTIIFALWDQEEQGLLGSAYFAGGQAANDDTIAAVVNMDAIAYDGNGDGLMRIHTRPIANSIAIKDTALMVNTTYGLNIPIAVNNPGATYSDHASFWNEQYGAILIIEDFDHDGNPHYHTPTDLVDYIDQPYYRGLAQLGIGTAAVWAVPVAQATAVAHVEAPDAGLFAFPNPAVDVAHLRWNDPGGPTRVELISPAGTCLRTLDLGTLRSGRQGLDLELNELAPGPYLVRVHTSTGAPVLRLLRLP